jgi:cob(I)alamin adenosyltransferase
MNKEETTSAILGTANVLISMLPDEEQRIEAIRSAASALFQLGRDLADRAEQRKSKLPIARVESVKRSRDDDR